MSHDTTSPHASMTSVDLTEQAHAARLPLSSEEVTIAGGFWADRQQVNRSVSLLAGAQHLEDSGNLHNLRLAAGRATGAYRTPANEDLPFLDSDVYKWLEAVGWELGRAPDAALEKLADDVIELVAAAQEEDGYLDSYYQVRKRPEDRWTNLANDHELYCAGHLIQAAVAHARGRGDTVLLEVARAFADHIDRRFGPDGQQGVGGHPEIEMALVELYRCTNEARYLDLARYFVDARGHGYAGNNRYGAAYMQDHQPVRDQRTVTGHAVRALYLTAGITDVQLETGEPELLATLEEQWRSMVSTKMYLTGGVGPRHRDEAFGDPYELPPDRAYNETCAAIASVMWSWRLLLATGDVRYADLIERTLYNAFAPGVSLDGQRYFYINRLQARIDPDIPSPAVAPRDSIERQEWFGCACCPPNVMRILSTMEHYLATTTDDGVQLHQYAAGSLATDVAGGRLAFEIHTAYPHDGQVTVVITEAPDAAEVELSLRVPSWCRDATLHINGDAVELKALVTGGYAVVTRRWRAGDEVVFDLPMAPRLVEPHPRIDAARGCVAIERGPLVYCLEGVDLPDGVDLADVRISSEAALTERRDDELLGGLVLVEAAGEVHEPQDWPVFPYRGLEEAAVQSPRPVTLTAIPYYAWANRGATTMRVWIPAL